MSKRTIAFVIVAILGAALFARLGVWQLHRLAERRALNARVEARMALAPVPVRDVPADTADARYRRVRVDGVADYAHELALTGRSREGSPGVWLITPVRAPGEDTAVLVARGWAYSPDGSTVDLARWREGDTLRLDGYVETFPPPRSGPIASPERPYAVHRLDPRWLRERLGYPIRPFYVMALADSATPAATYAARQGETTDSAPARFTLPALDEGPHRSYAIQWFSFAAIALVGTGIMVFRERRGA